MRINGKRYEFTHQDQEIFKMLLAGHRMLKTENFKGQFVYKMVDEKMNLISHHAIDALNSLNRFGLIKRHEFGGYIADRGAAMRAMKRTHAYKLWKEDNARRKALKDQLSLQKKQP